MGGFVAVSSLLLLASATIFWSLEARGKGVISMKPRALFPPSSPNSVVPVPLQSAQQTAQMPSPTSGDAFSGAENSPDGSHAAVVTALRESIWHLENSCQQVVALGEADGVAREQQAAHNQHLQAQIELLHAELSDASDLIEALQGQNEQLEREQADARDSIAELKQSVAKSRARPAIATENVSVRAADDALSAEKLLEQFGAVFDLKTEDLRGQIIQSACNVLGAGAGVFTNASAMDAVAMRGLPELLPRVAYELFKLTQQVREDDDLIIENAASRTPAGCGFSNLIALPFAIEHEAGGILLIANKSDGDFTERDARLLILLEAQALVALENARLLSQREELYNETVATLADAMETKDAYTGGHCAGVMRLALEVAQKLELKGEQLEEVRQAALLHDIGKVGVPDGILLNTGRLSDEEQEIMRRHALMGSELVASVPSLRFVADAILYHHEKWDGSGYPAGLAAQEIPLAARIVGTVDAFDAMTTPRLYRQAISAQEALDEMKRCAGTQFDPQIVDILDKLLEEGQRSNEHCVAHIEKTARPRADALKRSQEQSNYMLQVLEEREQEEREQEEREQAGALKTETSAR